MNIVIFHLFNDFSGSPKVLRGIAAGLAERGNKVTLVTSRGGTLDTVVGANVSNRRYSYTFSPNPAVTMVRYAAVQLLTFCMALRYAFSRDTVFYINTILPVGPALAGRLTGKKVVYHYHENAFVKSGFYRALTAAMQRLAHRIICVSDYQRGFLPRREGVTVVPNGNPQEFVAKLRPNPAEAFGRRNILMLGSLKEYKCVPEFITLSNKLPEFSFTLVVNDTQAAIDTFLAERGLSVPANLTIYPRQADVSRFYNEASLVVNLSDKERFIETFGLTAIEAMAAGLPVIVPTVGGIAEMVADGVNGYRIDVANLSSIENQIKTILSDRALYLTLAENALQTASNFHEDKCINSIEEIIAQA